MADGRRYKNKGFKFISKNFTLKEIKNLSSILKKKFNLNTNIYKVEKYNSYNLYIKKKNISILRNVVDPYIHPNMKSIFNIRYLKKDIKKNRLRRFV